MKIAVCVKYVPVVSRIKFDYEKKTIIREGVPSEVNPFDMLGLTRAAELKRGDGDSVIAISMGPPTAQEGLYHCLALGADKAVLLSDRAFAGSDTLATARALALALRREAPDLIICGRNSSDAETGQVGPELAELLGLPHISNACRLELSPDGKRVAAQRVTDDGHQVIECALPCVVCVTEGIAPERFANRQQLAAAREKPVEILTAADLSHDLSQFGAAGSPTFVQDIRLVEPQRLGVVIEDPDPQIAARQVAQLLKERLAALRLAAPTAHPAAGLRYPGQRERAIWVVAERGPQGLRRVTLELLGKARELAEITRSEVAALLLGDPDGLADALAAGGADRVLTLDTRHLGLECSLSVAAALSGTLQAERPYAVLFAASADGRDLASRIAARLGLGLTGDAIDLEIDAEGRLVQLKPALGGNVVAPILSRTLPNLVTLRPGLLAPLPPDPAARAVVEAIPAPEPEPHDLKLVSSHIAEDVSGSELAQAKVVVGVGKGVGGPEHLPALQKLAQALGASLATTRDVVHDGWLPHHIQVGISGRAIAPQVYLAVAVRGAFNHTVGIQKAGVILAINSSKRAPIFKAADYGIVGDWQTYLPPLVEALKPLLSGES